MSKMRINMFYGFHPLALVVGIDLLVIRALIAIELFRISRTPLPAASQFPA